MIVRNLDENWDWTFGAGKNNYRSDNTTDPLKSALAQSIKTRCLSFIGDCFFDLTAGINWFFYLGSRNRQEELQIDVLETIRNTPNVTGIESFEMNIDAERRISLSYTVNTVLGQLTDEAIYQI